MAGSTQPTVTISERKLETIIRKVVREVVHEELERALKRKPEVVEAWMSDQESPLYQDMVELREDARAGRMKLLTDQEIWEE